MAAPAARIIRPVDIEELRDAATAADAAARVIAKANAGEIDLEAAKFLLDSIEKFSALYERHQLEARVIQLEEQLRRAASSMRVAEAPSLSVIEGGLADEP
jgi:hypothetical protein